MFGKVDPRLLPYINDYRLKLITPGEIKDFEKFSSELGILMELQRGALARMCHFVRNVVK